MQPTCVLDHRDTPTIVKMVRSEDRQTVGKGGCCLKGPRIHSRKHMLVQTQSWEGVWCTVLQMFTKDLLELPRTSLSCCTAWKTPILLDKVHPRVKLPDQAVLSRHVKTPACLAFNGHWVFAVPATYCTSTMSQTSTISRLAYYWRPDILKTKFCDQLLQGRHMKLS